ncbi:MAG TPA: MopE-related protein [Polyangiaceae bacterium]|nr:MopE-related protein [Polyangiaceae bacterium]HOR34413.1 MopE-related protein [Polyangiaceae bacterium]
MNKQSLLIVFTALSACLVHGCGGDDGSESASNAGKGGTSSGKGGSGGSALGRDDDNDGYVTPQDCDDSNPDVHPGATEVCNGIDDNCDGNIDEGVLTTYYRDADNDGFGSNDPSARMQACSQPDGYVTISGDCDDSAWAINPDQTEIWGNDIDEDCDGEANKCYPGEVGCDGNEQRTCDSSGGWEPGIDCGAKSCLPLYGCVECTPGESSCDGNVVHRCLSDGSGWIEYECDPLVGSTCEQGACTGPCAPETLGRTYIGCDYYPTVTVNSLLGGQGGFDYFHFSVAISNTSSSEAQISITQGPATISSTTVPPDSVQVVHLPWTNLRTASATMIATQGAYRLRSTQPITVYQFNPLEYTANGFGTYTNDASLLIPVTAWGTRYMVAARNTWQYSGFTVPGFYSVVASEDATTVNLIPSATGSTILPGAGLTSGQGTVVLNRGDVLQVLSGPSGSDDLTGTLLEADKPIQVFGGHSCTYIPWNVAACDHLEESMFPVNTLASEYIVTPPSLPTLAQPKAFFVRVIAAEPAINVVFDPAVSAPITLNNLGDYVEIDANQPFHIQATGRILVSQYMKGQEAGGNSGDPAMALAVTSSQFRQSYLFHSPVNYEHNYVNIIAPDGAQVTLDGAPVTGFVPVGTTGYSDARLKLPASGNGNHHLEADQRVGITVYGYGQYTSYWYPGGLNLTELN